MALDEIGELLGLSNSSVEDIRADIRQKRRELADVQEQIERTLDVLDSY